MCVYVDVIVRYVLVAQSPLVKTDTAITTLIIIILIMIIILIIIIASLSLLLSLFSWYDARALVGDILHSAKGGVVGGGVQWMGVVLYNKLVYNII